MISSTILVQKLIVISVDEICFDVLIDKCTEMWHGFGSNTICAVYSPFDGVLPAQKISCLLEVLTEVFIEERSDLFGLDDEFPMLYIGKVH